jgi:putative phage-type endonuclease
MIDIIEQRSPEWHAARKGRVTASIVSAILGNSNYMTRQDAMRMLVREREGVEREFKGNPATEWGTYNEAGALAEFRLDTGLAVEAAPFVSFEDWGGGSPDGYTSDDGLVECKCPFGLRHTPAPVPFKSISEQPGYYDQMQFQMFVTGKRHCHFWQWTPHGTMRERVVYSQAWVDENVPRLRQFYAEYLDEPADDHLRPKRAVVDTPAAHMCIREWDEIAESLELLEARKKDLLAEMVAMAGDRDSDFAGRKLTLTKRKGSVRYKDALAHYAPKADLTAFQGKPSEFWGLK